MNREQQMARRTIILAACIASAVPFQNPIVALAQTPAAPPPPTATCPPRGNSQAPTTGRGGRGDLSEELSDSGGVICPPANIDPEIRRPAPESGGPMPVIPPPGNPGGDPTAQPK
jgi:hypothetical protein